MSYSGTPTSQNQGSQSDALSPLEISYAQGTPDVIGIVSQDALRPSSSSSSSTLAGQENVLRATSQSAAQAGNVQDRESRKIGQKRNASYLAEIQTNQSSAIAVSEKQATKINAPLEESVSLKGSKSATRHESQTLGDKPELARTADTAKVRHNIVERRYRENINAQVDVLRDSIVATMQARDDQQGTSSSFLGADELKRLTKAAVIVAATQQIKRARSSNERLLEEYQALQAQIKNLESQVKCGECPLMQLTFDMGLENPIQQPP